VSDEEGCAVLVNARQRLLALTIGSSLLSRYSTDNPPKTRVKKYIISVLCAIVAGISARGEDIITFWVRDSDQAIVDPLVKAYNARGGTNVKLSVIPAMQFVTKFATSIAGGTPPDVVAIDLIYVPAFSKAGQMTDLTEQAKTLPFFDKLSPSHIRLATYEGKLYAVPFSAEASVLVYNTDLFSKAGLDPNPSSTVSGILFWDDQVLERLGGRLGCPWFKNVVQILLCFFVL
jgi:multiple sugar transport system substrate-binding protein